jgi:hypothetical protein
MQAPCGGSIAIDKICLVGESASEFALEGPEGDTATGSSPAAIRITYNRQTPGGIDNVALVIESSSKDHPTLVVPVCAQVIDESGTPEAIECTSPVTPEEASCP